MVDLVAKNVDVIQIGSRNMQNYPLLAAIGELRKPVLLKRGFSATVEEWLCSAEYLAKGGNMDIIMCERGIRTFANGSYDRATLDLAAVDVLKRITPFPVIVDPSHAAGRADLVPKLALAGLCQGAHGLLIEVITHGTDREKVLCDGPQSIFPDELAKIINAAETTLHLLD
jgi:3-deoxy-7-phosphoheptulonate synthase